MLGYLALPRFGGICYMQVLKLGAHNHRLQATAGSASATSLDSWSAVPEPRR